MGAIEGAVRVVRDCVGVCPGDWVVIVTDTRRPPNVAQQLFLACQQLGVHGVQLLFDGNLPAGILPTPLEAAIESADVVFAVTTHTLGYAPVTGRCIRRGGRVVTMTEAPEDFLSNPALGADFAGLKERVVAVQAAFDRGCDVRVCAPGGTDLRFQIQGRQSSCCLGTCREPGVMAAVPDMEVYIAPLEGSAEGTLVADLSGTGLGMLEEPIEISVSEGRAVDIRGGRQAGCLAERIRSVSGGDVLAEFAIGLNPDAKPCGSIVIDEGVYGTGHFAFGSNTGFGGKNSCPQHLDLVYLRPTIWLDGQLFMKDGALC